MHVPTQTHMEAVYRVLRYLKGCPDKGIMYQKFDHQQAIVAAYSDADQVGSLID